MKFKVYPGYTSIGLIVDNDDSNCNLNYIDKEKRIQVRIPEIHGPNPEEFSYDNLDNTLFVKDEELPWIKAAIPAGLSSTMKKQLYPKGYSVYVKFITGDLERAVASFGDYMAGSIGTGSTVGSAGTGSPLSAEFIAANKGLWGIPLVDPSTGLKWSDFEFRSAFGYRKDPATGATKFHGGIDLGCSGGTNGKPLFASRDGTVVEVVSGYPNQTNNSLGYGNYIIIDHGIVNGDRYYTLYGHLKTVHVSEGSTVKGVVSANNSTTGKISTIAEAGTSGYATGPHLHFELRKGGNDSSSRIDPKPLLVDNGGNGI